MSQRYIEYHNLIDLFNEGRLREPEATDSADQTEPGPIQGKDKALQRAFIRALEDELLDPDDKSVPD